MPVTMEYGLGRAPPSIGSLGYTPEKITLKLVYYRTFYKGQIDDNINFQHSRGRQLPLPLPLPAGAL